MEFNSEKERKGASIVGSSSTLDHHQVVSRITFSHLCFTEALARNKFLPFFIQEGNEAEIIY